MDNRHLRYFVAVAEEMSFTRAAERLHTVQPSLSQQIQHLEKIVGTSLFHRQKHHLHLTEAGRVFLDEARAILQYTDRAIAMARQVARAEAGLITIGIVPGVEGKIFNLVLPIMLTKHPDVCLTLRSLTSPQQLAALRNREIHLGFLRPPIDDSDLVWKTIFCDKIVAVLPARHPLAKKKRIPVKSLAALPFLDVSRETAPALHDLAIKIAAQAGVTFQPILPANNVVTSLNEIASGLGFSLLPDYVCQILPAGAVARPLDCDPEPKFPLLAAYRRDETLPIVARFLDLLQKQMTDCAPRPTRE
jgi:LysR family hca operon transcriptional activator